MCERPTGPGQIESQRNRKGGRQANKIASTGPDGPALSSVPLSHFPNPEYNGEHAGHDFLFPRSKVSSMNRGAKIVVVLLFAVSAAFGGTQDDQDDERMLRLALAKIVFAHEVDVLLLTAGRDEIRQNAARQLAGRRMIGTYQVGPFLRASQGQQNTQPQAQTDGRPKPQSDAQPQAKAGALESFDSMMQRGLDQRKLKFTIADVSTGPISDIRDRMAGRLTWLPDGRTLGVGHKVFTHSTKKSDGLVHIIGIEDLAELRWGKESSSGQRVARQSLLAGIPSTCTRYVTAKITATYEGQIYKWKPVYLTGCNKPVRENIDVIASNWLLVDEVFQDHMVGVWLHPTVYALDPVMNRAVPAFWNADVYPYSLLDADGYRDSPKTRYAVVRDWLRNHASESCVSPKTTCFENGRVVIPRHDIPLNPRTTPSPGKASSRTVSKTLSTSRP